jgi:hypothetical protein
MERIFKIKKLGKPAWVLGFQICWGSNHLVISQKQYITTLISKYLKEDDYPVSTPLIAGKILSREHNDELTSEDKEKYRSIIGSLIYLSNGSRPDITYPVSVLAQFVSNPSFEHYNSALRILKYLKGKQDLALSWNREHYSNQELVGYSDSDFAGCTETRRSRSGYIFFYNNCAISWKSKKQCNVTLSTCEAEYYAATEAGKEGIHLSRILFELENGRTFSDEIEPRPVKLLLDNQSAIKVCKNPERHEMMKHVQVKLQWIRESVLAGHFVIEYVNSKLQVADMMTKPLSKPTLDRLGALCGITRCV